MNEDILAGKWKQLRGDIRETWGEITDDDYQRIAGQRDRLVGVLQERYGWSRDEAERRVDEFTRRVETRYGV